jgi:hypothetical protein
VVHTPQKLQARMPPRQPPDQVPCPVHQLSVRPWALTEGVGHKGTAVEVWAVQVACCDLYTADVELPRYTDGYGGQG